ncbi:MAG: UPF0158 family protein [Sedimentibacter saalensis]|uniref:UPF0158 family protein n=1 Tax=Sedimentibacter saalensis TaxID=130788 RepID=UPI003158BC5A
MKVKLQDVLEAMSFTNSETEYYYSTETEEVLMIFDGMVNGDDDSELIEEIEDGLIEDYIPLPGQYDIDEYSMMENFIYELPEGKAQDELENVIRGRVAYRRFKDKLYNLGLEQKWYKYRDDAYTKVAREWCERNNIEIIE